MAHDPLGQGSLNISDVIEVIQTTDPGFADVSTPFSETDMEDTRKKSVYVKIIEQPASKALRFRYKCEGRSAGSIPGVNSTPENKTFPTIEIVGYKGAAVVVVSCVTKDRPFRAHPHSLVGKEGCKRGICTVPIKEETMTASFCNLGIQCVKKKDIEEALKIREEIRVDPFRTGFSHRNQPTSIDLNAVRLCFQVFLEDGVPNKFTYPLTPVVSDPIYDKKAMSDLVICKLSDCTCTVAGGKEIILLCEKVAKEDIQIHFYEERDGNIVWEGFGDFQPTHVHKQVAISFRTPRYKLLEVEAPVKVNIQLRRPSDGATSEPLPFEYLPLDSGRPAFWSLRKALGKKGNYSMFSSILASNTALLTSGPPRNGADIPPAPWIHVVKPQQAGSESAIFPDGGELTKPVESENVIAASNVDGPPAPGVVQELVCKSTAVENGRSKIENKLNDVIIGDITDKNDKKSSGSNYAAINKWNKTASGEMNANADIQYDVERGDDKISSSGNEDVISQGETCRSLNELLSQVAELDEIYSDTQARLLQQGVTETVAQDSLSPNLDDSQSPQVIEMDVEDLYDDDNQTYSSLQLAMKNPIELTDLAPGRYEDIIPHGLSNQNNKRDISSSTSLVPESPDSKLPPLPPKRIRKSPPTPPARPDPPVFPQEPPITQAPDKTLPPTPYGTAAKQSKPSLFQKFFSKKSKPSSKKEGTLTPRAVSISREGSVSNVSTALPLRRGSDPVGQLSSPPQAQPELTEAEHYALYTDVAPHATVSEFDEMSFYYSPVEGGNIIIPGENIVNKNRDIFT
ncbi:embryonic polarity protein dorsal isoform X2 [Cryptotermes secundus]|nr:embryonic polarity protein dorsal isoform X2 [Cryptotermes secundus]XP_023722230.1 embryonic polarity protein dorsal isoform X2 [Cryptotermes secundus]XP_033610616.1 embryonic polarity protein dorsal isoform X2 [Cryptotermes secundus]